MKLLSEWMEKTQEERQAHLDLSAPCECGGHAKRSLYRLLDYLQITNDIPNRKKVSAGVLHACPEDSQRGFCINPQHLYFGTQSENEYDKGTEVKGRSGTKKGNPGPSKQIWVSLVDGFIANPANVAYHNKSIGADKADKLRISPRDYLYLLPLTSEERVETIKRLV